MGNYGNFISLSTTTSASHRQSEHKVSPGIIVMKFVCRVYTFYSQDYKKLYLAQVYQNGRQNKSLYL